MEHVKIERPVTVCIQYMIATYETITQWKVPKVGETGAHWDICHIFAYCDL